MSGVGAHALRAVAIVACVASAASLHAQSRPVSPAGFTQHLAAERAARAQDFQQAEADYRAAIASDPAEPEHHAALGRLLQSLGRDQEAAEALRAAARLQPDSADRQLELTRALLQLDRDAEALEHARAAAAHLPSDRAASVTALPAKPRVQSSDYRVPLGLSYLGGALASVLLTVSTEEPALLLTAPIAPAAAHFAHGHPGRGLASALLWPVFTVGGGLIGTLVDDCDAGDDADDAERDGCAAIGVGIVAGLVAWPVLDLIVNADDAGDDEFDERAGTPVTLHVAPQRGGAMIGIAGALSP